MKIVDHPDHFVFSMIAEMTDSTNISKVSSHFFHMDGGIVTRFTGIRLHAHSVVYWRGSKDIFRPLE
jgi:hypothetical protein